MQPLYPKRFMDQNSQQNTWLVNAAEGTTIEDLTNTLFWSIVSSKIIQGDRINVLFDDGTCYVELLVLGKGQGWASTVVLNKYDFVKIDIEKVTEEEAQFYYKYKGRHLGHSILRKEDNIMIKDGFETKELAVAFMNQYQVTVAA